MRIKARELREQRDEIDRLLETVFTDTVFGTIEKRSRLTADPDGFPTSSRLGPQSSSSVIHQPECGILRASSCTCDRAPELGSSTERQAMVRLGMRHQPDPQQEAFENIARLMIAALEATRKAARSWEVVVHIADPVKGRQTTIGTCDACAKTVPNVGSNRIRSGFCPACFNAWCRTAKGGSGRQDRSSFIRDRRS